MKAILIAAALATVPGFADLLAPTSAAKHVGENVTIEGVASVRGGPGGAMIVDVGGKAFSEFIAASDAAKFLNLQTFTGKVVDVSGLVRMENGKPEMILSDPFQLRLASHGCTDPKAPGLHDCW